MRDRRLVRELVVVVVIKLALLTALWWVFVRDARVTVDPEAMTAHAIATPAGTVHPTPGASDGQ